MNNVDIKMIKNLKTLESAKKMAKERSYNIIMCEEIEARRYSYTNHLGDVVEGYQTRQYHIFNNIHDFIIYYKNCENKHFHEVIQNERSKLAFDFDISKDKYPELPATFFDDVENIIQKCIKDNIKNIKYGGDYLKFMWLTCENEKKFSYHLIIDNIILLGWVEISKFIYHKLKELIDNSENFKWIKSTDLIDIPWIKNNSSLRILNSSKLNGNPLKFLKDYKLSRVDDYLCSFVGYYKYTTDIDDFDSFISISDCINYYLFASNINKYISNVELTDEKYKFIVKKFQEFDKDKVFSITDIVNNVVQLKRNKSSVCECCNRSHDNENAYLTINKNNHIRLYCYRNKENKFIQIYKEDIIYNDFWSLCEPYSLSKFIDSVQNKFLYNHKDFEPSELYISKFISIRAFIYQLSKLCRYIQNNFNIIMKVDNSKTVCDYEIVSLPDFCKLFIQDFKIAYFKDKKHNKNINDDDEFEFEFDKLTFKKISIKDIIARYGETITISCIHHKDKLIPDDYITSKKPTLFPRYCYLKYTQDYSNHPKFNQIKTMFWQQIRRLTGSKLILKSELIDLPHSEFNEILFSNNNYGLIGEYDSALYVLHCLAWMIQKPYSKWRRALVFHSKFKQLGGKSLFFKQIYANLLIRHYHATAEINKERGDLFNTQLLNKFLVLFEEEFFKPSELSYFKEFITGDELNFRQMHKSTQSYSSYHNVILNTNTIGDVSKVIYNDTERFCCFSMDTTNFIHKDISNEFNSLLATTFGINSCDNKNTFISSKDASYLLYSWLKDIDISNFFPNSSFTNDLTNRIKNKDDFIDIDGSNTLYYDKTTIISDPIHSFIDLVLSDDNPELSDNCYNKNGKIYLPNILSQFRIWAKTYSYNIPSNDTTIRASIKQYFISLGYTSEGPKSTLLSFSKKQ
jgi:hypothetical protein